MGAKGGEAIVGENWGSAPFLGWTSGTSSHILMREAIEATHTIIAMLQSSLVFALKRLERLSNLKFHHHSAGLAKAALPSVLLDFTS